MATLFNMHEPPAYVINLLDNHGDWNFNAMFGAELVDLIGSFNRAQVAYEVRLVLVLTETERSAPNSTRITFLGAGRLSVGYRMEVQHQITMLVWKLFMGLVPSRGWHSHRNLSQIMGLLLERRSRSCLLQLYVSLLPSSGFAGCQLCSFFTQAMQHIAAACCFLLSEGSQKLLHCCNCHGPRPFFVRTIISCTYPNMTAVHYGGPYELLFLYF
ncbi:hypothetical protein HPP92_010875 [Vanilla planifolia]|uniref:Uncharacterized protein n=1 Tax=Vanilla planifolia TaxID=51239 RepID=A0A835R4Z1_VANPL|nr:hypothetical protein HPP92_010875 [Vanilla planifolia]